MNRHPLDVFSLIAGLVCTGVALYALTGPRDVTLADLRLVGPVVVLLLGVALLTSGAHRDRS